MYHRSYAATHRDEGSAGRGKVDCVEGPPLGEKVLDKPTGRVHDTKSSYVEGPVLHNGRLPGLLHRLNTGTYE